MTEPDGKLENLLDALIEKLADKVHSEHNALPLDQTIAQLAAAITLYEMLMPEGTPSEGLHDVFKMLKDARDRAIEGPSRRRDNRDDAEAKVCRIAAVRFFANGSTRGEDVAAARKRVAAIVGTSPKKLKRLETQWIKRQSRADGLPVTRGTLDPEAEAGRAVEAIRQAVASGADPDTFIREICATITIADV